MRTRSGKRKNQDVHTSTCKRKKVMKRMPKTAGTSALLTLPNEILTLILKELLRAPSPLREGAALFPAILRTCKAFTNDDKRSPLLDGNTFGIDLWIDDWDDRMTFFRYNISETLRAVPRSLLPKVQNVDIIIHVLEGAEDIPPLTENASKEHRNAVVALIDPLKAFSKLENLSITVSNAHELAEDNQSGNDILTSLQGRRGLKCVTIKGVSPTHAMEMKTCMESKDAVEDFRGMQHALREYLGQEYADDEDWPDINDAVGAYNLEIFKGTRQRIVERIESARTALLVQLYQHDR